MQILCPQCGQVVSADALNMQQLVGKCARCNRLFSFQEQLPQGGASTLLASIDAPRPASITVAREGLGLRFTWRWFRYYVFFLIPFALFWNAIVLGFVGPMLVMPIVSWSSGDFNWLSLFSCLPVFILPHTLVGLWLIYYIATLFANQTTVQVDQGTITVRHAPLPWIGNKSVPAGQIAQLYVKSGWSRYQRGEMSYELHLIDRNQQHAKLLGGLPSSEHALYLEQEIERFLGIEDRPVRGEFR